MIITLIFVGILILGIVGTLCFDYIMEGLKGVIVLLFIVGIFGVIICGTWIIGNHVKIYQNVTLGALSLENGQLLKGIKRHPTIGNNVTLYAGSSILGGNTIVEDNVIIGSNVCLKGSVSSNSVIK